MKFINFEESLKMIKSIKINSYKTKKLYLCDALGYRLAEDIISLNNSPEFPTSAMDGYAIKYQDQKLDKIKIISINPAGSALEDEVVNGTAIKTFTGSLMPKGSDTLIPIENVKVEGDYIKIIDKVEYGFSVREIGENYSKNQNLIPKNTLIDIAQIGVMASLNIVSVLVYDKPIVSIISTGSELLELGEEQTNDSQIRSSNNYILEALVKKYGGRPLQLGCIKDDIDTITTTIKGALSQSDIVVTTGGVSVGDFDFVEDVVKTIGCKVIFKGVRIKPGQHIMVAKKRDGDKIKFIISLPGFAYSSTVTALLYLVPLMAKFQKADNPIKIVNAILKEPFVKRAKKAEFTACNLSLENGEYKIDFKDKKIGSSAILTNMLGNIALLYTKEDDSNKSIGDIVKVVVI
jgi:molybdopterin molybdotransferase